tara:strand:+ start:202 stop:438 length:237 start_codon:yes stop_codon:yes gene_type:complete
VKKISAFLAIIIAPSLSLAHEGGHQLMIADHGVFMGLLIFALSIATSFALRAKREKNNILNQAIKIDNQTRTRRSSDK